MPSTDPRSWLDKVVGACLAFLVGAAAVFIAVKLLLSVLTALILIIVIVGFIVLAITILRARNRGW